MREHPLPPRHVCIAASLLLAFGVAALVRMLAGAWYGSFSIDLGFIGLAIGHGVLTGSGLART